MLKEIKEAGPLTEDFSASNLEKHLDFNNSHMTTGDMILKR